MKPFSESPWWHARATLALLAAVLLGIPASAGQGPARSLSRSGDATLAVQDHGGWTEIEVVAVEGTPQSIRVLAETKPGAWCLPLNYWTRVQALPGSGALVATAHAQTGIVGARIAVVPPQPDIRHVLQDVIAHSDLWLNHYGGPWALDHVPNFDSYLMTLPDGITRDNVDAWIRLCKAVGVSQIDWVHSFRYGDYVPRPDLYPGGWDDVRFIVARLHRAGILSILHTYSFAIAPGASMFAQASTKPGPQSYRLPSTLALLDEIAGNLAAALDRGEFDGVYFDALDWAGLIQGRDWGWYWAGRFVHETGRRLKRPDLIVETAMFSASIWGVTSRYGSLDYEGTDWRSFVDRHAARLHPEYLLPSTMGWMPVDGTRSLADIDYLTLRARGSRAGISWRNLTPSSYERSEWVRRVAHHLKTLLSEAPP